MALAKSTIHSIKFWKPVGCICKFRQASVAKTNTISDARAIISTLDRSNVSQEIPNAFSIMGAFVSNMHHLFHSKNQLINMYYQNIQVYNNMYQIIFGSSPRAKSA